MKHIPPDRENDTLTAKIMRRTGINRINLNAAMKIALGVSIALNAVYGYTVCQRQAETKPVCPDLNSPGLKHFARPDVSAEIPEYDKINKRLNMKPNHDLLFVPDEDEKDNNINTPVKL